MIRAVKILSVLGTVFVVLVVVAAHGETLTITTTSCAGGKQYRAYKGCKVKAKGGKEPYTWSSSNGKSYDILPEGLTLDASTGDISSAYILGMGVYKTQVTVTDETGATATQVISIAIDGDTKYLKRPPFPADAIWDQDISALPVDTSPAAQPLPEVHVQAVFGSNADDGGIPVIQVPADQQNISTTIAGGVAGMFSVAPWRSDAPIEGSGNCEQNGGSSDCHSLVIQLDDKGKASIGWEMYQAQESSPTAWESTSQGFYSFTGYGLYTQDSGQGTDAAGLPVAPLLANYDAVMSPNGQRTPLRATFDSNNMLARHVWPATAQAGGGYTSGGYEDGNGLISQLDPPTEASTGRIPFGEEYRIKAETYANPPAPCLTDFQNYPQAASLFREMRNFGIIAADNGYSGFIGVVGTNDARWNDADLACLNSIAGSDFEPVNVQGLAQDWPISSRVIPKKSDPGK